jgi:hypothetical protein
MAKSAAATLLQMWEQAGHCDPPSRALRLLAWALPDEDGNVLADLDLGERDWHLLRLRRRIFGPRVSGQGRCPHCGSAIEVEFDARDVQGDAPLPPAPLYTDARGRQFRLPRCRDLIEAARSHDVESAELELFHRCAVDSEHAGGADFDDIDRGLATLAAERQLQLGLACETCAGEWTLAFDSGAFLWEEIEARAMALLDDVHRLALAYGWSERTILSMSEARRAAYLERLH